MYLPRLPRRQCDVEPCARHIRAVEARHNFTTKTEADDRHASGSSTQWIVGAKEGGRRSISRIRRSNQKRFRP
jgi:hypothetical protein